MSSKMRLLLSSLLAVLAGLSLACKDYGEERSNSCSRTRRRNAYVLFNGQCRWKRGCFDRKDSFRSKKDCLCSCAKDCPSSSGSTSATKEGACPNRRRRFGTCTSLCRRDADCRRQKKCCFNGCGRSCVKPLRISPPAEDNRCPAGEVFKSCGSSCEAACGDEGRGVCNKRCRRGCFCPSGLVRGPQRRCVPREKCPGKDQPGGSERCGANQVFKSCGSACEKVCGQPAPQICTLQCVIGCQCAPGFELAEPRRSGVPIRCVASSGCGGSSGGGPRTCGRNERLASCGTSCPKVCGQPQARFCTEDCFEGCECAPGFELERPRDRGANPLRPNRCVRPSQCPSQGGSQTCGRNERFTECGSSCPKVCGQSGPSICTADCFVGCECAPGFERAAGSGPPRSRPCVPTDECNSQDDVCSLPPVTGRCRARMMRWHFDGRQCSQFVYGGCGANANNFRSKAACERRCPEGGGDGAGECGRNAEWSQCSSPTPCQRRCGVTSDMACPAVCMEGCKCKRGFLLAPSRNDCISEAECRLGIGGGGGAVSNPCDARPCRSDQRCLHRAIECFTTPCPQHRCLRLCPPTFVDPCRGLTCPAVPDAKCEQDESCNGTVFIKDGRDVTAQCFRRG